jgi:hypothetical protein
MPVKPVISKKAKEWKEWLDRELPDGFLDEPSLKFYAITMAYEPGVSSLSYSFSYGGYEYGWVRLVGGELTQDFIDEVKDRCRNHLALLRKYPELTPLGNGKTYVPSIDEIEDKVRKEKGRLYA